MNEKNPESEPHRIDDINRRLYDRRYESHDISRHNLSHDDNSVPSAWESLSNTAQNGKRTPIMKLIFICALIFCVGAIVFMLISLSQGRTSVSNDNIKLTSVGKQFIDAGEDVGYRLTITNKNSVPLELVDLVLEYSTTSNVVPGRGIERTRRTIGTILPRQNVEEEFDIVLYGQEGDERYIKASLEYRIGGSNAIFVKEDTFNVSIRSAPVVIQINAPDSVVTNQPLTFSVDVRSLALSTLNKTLVRLEYPSGFQFDSAEPPPTSGTTDWVLGDLAPGASHLITIHGFLVGNVGEEKTVTSTIGTFDESNREFLNTIYGSSSHMMKLEKPFISAVLSINNSIEDKVIVDESDAINVIINWTNSLPTKVSDVRITTKMQGGLFDAKTIRVQNGRYDSNTGVITWNQDTQDELNTLEPGENGTSNFFFNLNPIVNTTTGGIIRSPRMDVSVDIRATGSDGTIYTAQDVDMATILINSALTLEQGTLHSSGPFAITGQVPPSSGQITMYTLHWKVHNSANPVSDAVLTAHLPTEVTWLGRTSPNSENITYNTETRNITWNMGPINAGVGFSTSAREAYMAVSITPSSTDVGTIPYLTGDITLSATDTYTKQQITTTKRGHTTQLMGDTTQNDGLVVK